MSRQGPTRSSPYAGRWVARVRGRIVAHGGTPEQARLAAQHSRPREKLEVVYMPPEPRLALSPLLDEVQRLLPQDEVYLVGGALRDALMGRVSHDLDFAVPRQAIPLARRMASALQADFYVLDGASDCARLLLSTPTGERRVLDFSAFRGPNLDSDLRGRDFTINAMAFDLRRQAILDPLGGAADLRARLIRACSPNTFTDDPLRILRAVRLAAALEFKIEPATRKAMRAALSLLPNVSIERRRDELFKMLEGPRPQACLRALDVLGALPHLLPELRALKGVAQPPPHTQDVWEHTLSTLSWLEEILAPLAPDYRAEQTHDLFTGLLTLRLGRYRQQFASHLARAFHAERSPRALLFFAALYHDIAKPATKSVDQAGRIRFFDHEIKGAQITAERAGALRLSQDEIEHLKTLVAHHMRFHFFTALLAENQQGLSRKAIYHFFRDAGRSGIDLIPLGLADLRATHGHALKQETWAAALEVARQLLENYWEKPHESIAPPRLVDGHDVIEAYHLEPGPLVGQVLEAIREAQATGKIATREEALAFGQRWLEEHQT